MFSQKKQKHLCFNILKSSNITQEQVGDLGKSTLT